MTVAVVPGSFSAPGTSDALTVTDSMIPARNINISIGGTFTGSITVQRSFDGSTWFDVSKNSDGAAATYTAPTSLAVLETEAGAMYRLNCTALSAGTAVYRISR